MDKYLRSKIYLVALETRAWAEENVEKILNYPALDLGGLCAVAASELFIRLGKIGVQSTLCSVSTDDGGHCFVEVDGWIVDVTATQFGSEFGSIEIFSSKRKPARFTKKGDRWWKDPMKFSSIKELKKYLADWPDNQQPLSRQLRGS